MIPRDWLAGLVFGVLCFAAGWWLADRREPDVVTHRITDTLRVTDVLPDWNDWTPPDLVAIHAAAPETEPVCDTFPALQMPTGFDLAGLIGPGPVRIRQPVFGAASAELRFFDPHAGRWQVSSYAIEEPDWRIYPEVGLEQTVYGSQAAARVNVEHERLRGFVGYGQGFDHRDVTFGLYLRPFTMHF